MTNQPLPGSPDDPLKGAPNHMLWDYQEALMEHDSIQTHGEACRVCGGCDWIGWDDLIH